MAAAKLAASLAGKPAAKKERGETRKVHFLGVPVGFGSLTGQQRSTVGGGFNSPLQSTNEERVTSLHTTCAKRVFLR